MRERKGKRVKINWGRSAGDFSVKFHWNANYFCDFLKDRGPFKDFFFQWISFPCVDDVERDLENTKYGQVTELKKAEVWLGNISYSNGFATESCVGTVVNGLNLWCVLVRWWRPLDSKSISKRSGQWNVKESFKEKSF